MNNKRTLSTILKIILPVVILLVVLVIRFRKVSDNGFNPARYVLIDTQGIDGRGRILLSYDKVSLVEALCGSDADERTKALYEKFADSITYEADRTDGLSNGDAITITVSYDSKAAREAGVTIDDNIREYKVTGLNKGTAVDAFKDLQIVTDGISPFVTVTVDNLSKDEYISTLSYEVDKPEGNAIGDTVTIRCLADEDEAAALGYYFETTSMTYTITTADRYAGKAEDLDMNVIRTLAKESADVVTNLTADTTFHMAYTITGKKDYLYRDGNEEAVNFDIYKVELADNTTDTMGSHGNYVLIYVKGQIRTPDYSGGEDPYEYIDAYFCFVFCDAVITRTGEFTMAVNDIEQRYICNSSFDAVKDDARTFIGAGYEYTDVPLN